MKTNLIHKLCIRFLLLAMTITTVTATPVSRTRDLVTEDETLPRRAADPIHVEMNDFETRGWSMGKFFGPSPTLPYSTHDLPNTKPKLGQIPSHPASHETNAAADRDEKAQSGAPKPAGLSRVNRPLQPPPKKGETKGDPYLRPLDLNQLSEQQKQSRRQVVIDNYAAMMSASFTHLGMNGGEVLKFFQDPKNNPWALVDQLWKDTMRFTKFSPPQTGREIRQLLAEGFHGSPKIEVKYREFDEL